MNPVDNNTLILAHSSITSLASDKTADLERRTANVYANLKAAFSKDYGSVAYPLEFTDNPGEAQYFQGKISIGRPFLESVQRVEDAHTSFEDIMAGILGHEIVHGVKDHARDSVFAILGGLVGFLMAIKYAATYAWDSGANIATCIALPLATLALALFVIPYAFVQQRRRQENVADLDSLPYIARAGYDPRAVIAFHKQLIQTQGDGEPPTFTYFPSTHPRPSVRIAALESRLSDLKLN